MRIAHLGDFHLGRKINDYSIIESQREILNQIADKIDKKEIETVIIAGDVYDASIPEPEAVAVLSEFLTRLRNANKDVFMIAGNHDPGSYIEYGGDLLREMDIHVTGTWKGKLECVDLLDRFGPLHVYCLPYITPADINRYITNEEERVEDFDGAVRYAISTADINWEERNILVAHQYVSGAEPWPNGSEDYLTFDSGGVNPEILEGFEYVALGHIHNPQSVGKDTIRYCGAPLKFNAEETDKECSFTYVTLSDKGDYRISTVLLEPEQKMERLEGTFEQLVSPEFYEAHRDNLLTIILDEEKDIPDAITSLRKFYPYILGVSYSDGRIQTNHIIRSKEDMTIKDAETDQGIAEPLSLFAEFYTTCNGTPMSEKQKDHMEKLIREVFSEETA